MIVFSQMTPVRMMMGFSIVLLMVQLLKRDTPHNWQPSSMMQLMITPVLTTRTWLPMVLQAGRDFSTDCATIRLMASIMGLLSPCLTMSAASWLLSSRSSNRLPSPTSLSTAMVCPWP